MEEFAHHGYQKASTNRMVKKAGISKGTLFNYFKSKQQLFNYVIDYCIEFIETHFIDHLDINEPDFIKRYSKAAEKKLRLYTINPHVFNFIGTIFIKETLNIPSNLRSRLEEIQNTGMAKLYQNIDTDLFRDVTDPDTIIKLIQWSIDGFQDELIADLKQRDFYKDNLDQYWEKFYDFLELLHTLFYK